MFFEKYLIKISLLIVFVISGCSNTTAESQQDTIPEAPTNRTISLDDTVTASLTPEASATLDSVPIITYTTSKPNTLIYFTVKNESENELEVWQTNIDATLQGRLFTLPILYPISVLPPQEFAILKHNYCLNQSNGCPTDLTYKLGNLTLSPDKQKLAWVDQVGWCPSTRCYGFQRIVTWDLQLGEMQVLLEIPNHIDLGTTQNITKITWSPGSDQIGFVQASPDKSWSRLRILDLGTKQIRDIGEGSNFVWAPNGTQIATIIQLEERSQWGIKIVDNNGTIQAMFSDDWELIQGIDWSYDSSKIAITALKALDENSRFQLIVIDVLDNKVFEVGKLSLDQSYEHPKWSPDGRFLGVNIVDRNTTGLLLFDSQDTTIQVNKIAPGFADDDWLWADNGEAILMLVNKDSTGLDSYRSARIGVFHNDTSNVTIIPLPFYLEEGLDSRELHLGKPTW